MNLHGSLRVQGDDPSQERQQLSALESGILGAVAYADIFDYPLTLSEIHRYLVGVRASRSEVGDLLSRGQPLSGRVSSSQGFFCLAGREANVEIRLRRSAVAASMWPRAMRYGRAIGSLPFVRMVAVTGALAMDNVDPGTDIDFLVVTEPGRLWLCRAMVVGLVKVAARTGDEVCPNYFLSERALMLGKPDLFTAHELAQMVPVVGLESYQRMCRLNDWAAAFLPNAFGLPRPVSAAGRVPSSRAGYYLRGLSEAALRTPVGGWVEQWEMRRKLNRLGASAERLQEGGQRSAVETGFCADWCKGHFDSHGQRTLEAFSYRLRSLALSASAEAEIGLEPAVERLSWA